MANVGVNPLRTVVYICHQNQSAKNIGNFMIIETPQHRYSFERYWDKLSGGTIVFYVLQLLGKLYHFLKFS
jgi:hypothetical protein